MELYPRGNRWWVSFYVANRRRRLSTKVAVSSKNSEKVAERVAIKRIAEIEEKNSPIRKKAPILRDFWKETFLPRIEKLQKDKQMAPKTAEYYVNGWKLLFTTRLAAMQMDEIKKADVEALVFGSPAWSNTARRTLSAMLGHAKDDLEIIGARATVPILEHDRRERTISAEEEVMILERARPILADVLITIMDAGPRPAEVLEFRWECFNWLEETIFIPRGKTKKARRFIPMTERMRELYLRRWIALGKQKEGWVFPSDGNHKSKSGHKQLGWLQIEFAAIRDELKLKSDLVLYCARHTFATSAIEATGNVVAVSQQLGHENLDTTMIYVKRQGEKQIRSAMNNRNRLKTEKDTVLDTAAANEWRN